MAYYSNLISLGSLQDTFGCRQILSGVGASRNIPQRLRDSGTSVPGDSRGSLGKPFSTSKIGRGLFSRSPARNSHYIYAQTQAKLQKQKEQSLERFVVQENFARLLRHKTKKAGSRIG